MAPLSGYQAKTFGVGSTVSLAKFGGATLGGIWISTKGTTPTITVYDASASVTGKVLIAATTSLAKGFQNIPAIECGNGLAVKTASCTGTIFWRPGPVGGV